jgi:ribosomal protein L24E
MSFLYRAAITITRRQPYIDWANGTADGGAELTGEVANDRRTVYLVAEYEDRSDLGDLIDDHWEDIFEEELAAWTEDESGWPASRTREMFDQWFGAGLTESVIDLDPESPLTQRDVELVDLADAFQTCAWCDLELEKGEGRTTGFPLADRERFASREGLVLPIQIDKEDVLVGIVTPRDSDDARAGNDLLFRVCSSRCEKVIRKLVPKALRRMVVGS